MAQLEIRPGTTLLDRYRVSRVESDGLLGATLLARDTETRRQVRVQLVAPRWMEGNEDRFRTLCALTRDLGHPVPVPVIDLGIEAGMGVRVVAFDPGPLLETRVGADVLVSMVVDWLAAAARGISVAHERGLVHGQLSPAAIRLPATRDGSGPPRIDGWGLAGLLDWTDSNSSTGLTELGGAGWISPEFARGLPRTTASDVYSLGAVLYALLVGDAPFTGPSMKVVAAHCTMPASPPSKQGASIPDWLDELTVGMLAKAETDRPTAEEVADLLESLGSSLADRAAQNEHVTANAAPIRRQRSTVRGAHSQNLELPTLERPALPATRPPTWLPWAVAILAAIAVLELAYWFWRM